MNMAQRHSIVIGGGASGLMAANRIHAQTKPWGAAPLVLEGNPKLGKKLLATGNGRCNLTNLDISPSHYHGDPLAAVVLKRYPAERILEEFRGMGLLCRADGEGRVYPRGNQATAVLQTLGRGLGDCIQEAQVTSVKKSRDGFLVRTADGQAIEGEKLVLACGGMASPAHSMGGGGYELAKSLGHTVRPLSPSLVPLKTDSRACKALKGMRVKARAALYQAGQPVYAESGEVLFGGDRLSGICVFNLSARLRETGGRQVEVGLDLLEDMALPEVEAYLLSLRDSQCSWPSQDLFSGALNLRVGQEVAKAAGIPWQGRLGRLDGEQIRRAARLAKDWRFPITGAGSWSDAQVTAGGVPLSEIDLGTMESKVCPGLYLTGELLDVDGDCGGYNLHWAWATGMAAGQDAGKMQK